MWPSFNDGDQLIIDLPPPRLAARSHDCKGKRRGSVTIIQFIIVSAGDKTRDQVHQRRLWRMAFEYIISVLYPNTHECRSTTHRSSGLWAGGALFRTTTPLCQ